jgi:TM2 domain-containing membrane protein YozV
MDEKRHHAGIAAVLSFVFNGLGQLYVGKIKQGLIIMTISAVSMILIIAGAVFAGHWIISRLFSIWELIIGLVLLISGIIIACVVGIYSINDAYKEALK